MIQLRRQTAVTITVAILLCAGASALQAESAQRTRLANGVTVITKPFSWNRIVAVAVTVEAGSKYDPPKLAGLAGMTSELLLEGTEDRSAMELAVLADRHGIELDTYATVDFAGFHLACIDENLDAALELAADILTSPSFDESRFLRVQEDLRNRIDRDNEDSVTRSHQQLYEVLFNGHPYSRPVSGTAKTVENITPEHVRRFYEERYTANNTVVSIVGNFDEDSTIERLEELLSDYSEEGEEAPRRPEITRSSREISEIYMDVSDSRLAIGYVTPPAPHRDYASLRVLAALLGHGRDSRLQRALVEEDAMMAEGVSAHVFSAVDHAALVISCGTSDVESVVEIIEAELSRLQQEPVSDEELRVARNAVNGSIVIHGQTNRSRALRLSIDYLAYGRLDALDTFLEQIERVSRDDILRVAREHLVDPAVAIVRPGRSAEGERGPVRRGI